MPRISGTAAIALIPMTGMCTVFGLSTARAARIALVALLQAIE
jgi:hypothetical protein